MRHARGDMGTLLAFARRPPPLATTWRARCGSRPGFARRVPMTPRRPPVVGAQRPRKNRISSDFLRSDTRVSLHNRAFIRDPRGGPIWRHVSPISGRTGRGAALAGKPARRGSGRGAKHQNGRSRRDHDRRNVSGPLRPDAEELFRLGRALQVEVVLFDDGLGIARLECGFAE